VKPVYRLLVPDGVAELIAGLHPRLKQKVRASLKLLLADPYAGKPLKEELAGLWSFRTGNFRIIYRPSEEQVIELIALGPRARIYEETLRLLSRQDSDS
jgi:mRNA interferase RelE/StbE